MAFESMRSIRISDTANDSPYAMPSKKGRQRNVKAAFTFSV
jgi:hypothetical protein